MRYFWVMFLGFILMFTNTFYALTTSTTFYDQLKYTFFISIRYFDTEVFDQAETTLEQVMLWVTFFLSSMFFLYILLNMTVSMVKGFYDQNMRIKSESAYQVMA